MTRKIHALLAEYGESHRDPANKLIHWFCVPAIFWTIAALLWSIPVPAAFAAVPYLNWLTIILSLCIVYYIALSPRLAVGIALYCLLCVWLIVLFEQTFALPLWKFALDLFVLAWIGQFIGHKIEGKKPSFFKDVQFLLIGPAWLLGFVYDRLGIRY